MLKRIYLIVGVIVALLAGYPGSPREAHAQKLSFIRDAEIESNIRAFAAPLFRAAGLQPDAVRVYLVKDDALNAFVAGGQKLFLNTGLIMRTDSAAQLIGVIAHETGHIAAGHLVRINDALGNASAQSILAAVLGVAAGIVAGNAEVGQAVLLGGQSAVQRSLLSYTRTQEAAADQAALRLLDATNQTAQGLVEFFEILGDQDLVSPRFQDAYVRTHPLTRDRVKAVAHHVSVSRASRIPTEAAFGAMHQRMRAKLVAFLKPFTITLRRYPETDRSLDGRYARAIAHYRRSDLPRALALMDDLLAEHPADPYFHELKGQALFEAGRIAESLPSLEQAVRLTPRAAPIRLLLARAQIETKEPRRLDGAIDNLRHALQQEPQDAFAWRQLAIAHGLKGEQGESSLALAEEALLRDKPRDAAFHAARAQSLLPEGSPSWFKAGDVVRHAEDEAKKEKSDR